MAKRQPRDSKREAYWRGVMTRFGKSDLTVRGFCAQERVSEPSFYAWRRVIRERDAEARVAQPAFVPVVMGEEPGGNHDAGLAIELRGGHVLRLPATVPMRQVAELIHAMETTPSTPEDRP